VRKPGGGNGARRGVVDGVVHGLGCAQMSSQRLVIRTTIAMRRVRKLLLNSDVLVAGDVFKTGAFGGIEKGGLLLLGLGHLVKLKIGELEKGEGTAVGHAEKGVAERDFLLHFRAETLLAPGRDQRNPEDVLEKAAVDFVVADHEGIMVQARRQAGWQSGSL
jgi:hypothetical protein